MSNESDFSAYEHSGRGFVATEGELQNRFHTYEVKDDNPERTKEEMERIRQINAEKEQYMKEHGHDLEPPKKEGLLSKILPGKHGHKDEHGDKEGHGHESHQHEHGHEREHGQEHEHHGVGKTLLHGNHDDEIQHEKRAGGTAIDEGADRRAKDRAIDEENARRDAAAGSGGSADQGVRTDSEGHILIQKSDSHPDDPVLLVSEQK